MVNQVKNGECRVQNSLCRSLSLPMNVAIVIGARAALPANGVARLRRSGQGCPRSFLWPRLSPLAEDWCSFVVVPEP